MVCTGDEPGGYRTVEFEEAFHGVSGEYTGCVGTGIAERDDNDRDADVYVGGDGRYVEVPGFGVQLYDEGVYECMVYGSAGELWSRRDAVYGNAGDSACQWDVQMVGAGMEPCRDRSMGFRVNVYEPVTDRKT